ncbi:hypothetical protein AAGW05_06160 [Arthrobacter sp. LAPM80]|uniref:hypothetical protein n=1 Tax=Arthrobacter sp. LAPM80 TaxID=3141788 RepID=UPI00398B8F7B
MTTLAIPARDTSARLSADMAKFNKRLDAVHAAKQVREAPAWFTPLDGPHSQVEAPQCEMPGCVESGAGHGVDSLHMSRLEWLSADKAIGPFASMSYTLDDGKPGFYLEWSLEPVEGSLADMSALEDALRGVAAQLGARAKTSPFHASEA